MTITQDECCYINVQKWMVSQLKLRGNELLVYALIHGFCQDGVSCYYGSIDNISNCTGAGRDAVIRCLEVLTEKGLIIKKTVYQKLTNTGKINNAYGCIKYCVYYTQASRDSIVIQEVSCESATSRETRPATSRETRPATSRDSRLNNIYLNSNLKKSSSENTSRCSEHNLLTKDNSAEEEINKYLIKLFPDSNFSENFITKITKLLQKSSLNKLEYQEYFDWAYQECKNKVTDQVKLQGYFYKAAAEPYFFNQFIQMKEQTNKSEKLLEESLIECPVCKTKHSYFDSCPVCELRDSDNKLEVEFRRCIYNLPVKEKENLEIDLNKVYEKYSGVFKPPEILKRRKEISLIYLNYIKNKSSEFNEDAILKIL